LKVKVNGVDVPAVLLKLFKNLEFQVVDTKNSYSNTLEQNGMLKTLNGELSITNLLETFDGCIQDFAKLINNNIKLNNQDAVNFALTDNGFRLFLTDLGDCQQQKPSTNKNNSNLISLRARVYTHYFISVLVQSLNTEERSNFNDSFDYDSIEFENLEKQITQKIIYYTSDKSLSV
jgi:hypothetical protein